MSVIPSRLSDPARLTRDDLATLVTAYEAESKRLNSRGASGMLAGVIIAMVLLGIGRAFSTSDDWIPLISIFLYAAIFGSLGVEWWYRRRMTEQLQIECAFCSQPLFNGSNSKDVIRRAELIAASGRCSRCGHEFVHTEPCDQAIKSCVFHKEDLTNAARC